MYPRSLEAYKNVRKTGMTRGEIEAFLLNDAALKLKYCKDNWEDDEDDPEDMYN